MFDLETGILSSGSVSSDSLMDLAPDPTGTGRRVKVNSKGLVVEIVDEDLAIAPRMFRAVFLKDSGVADTVAGVQQIQGHTDISRSVAPYWYTEYEWVVPDIVTRVGVTMIGGGMGYKENEPAAGSDANFYRFNWIVYPGETLIIRVGHGMPNQTDPNLHRVSQSSVRAYDNSRSAITSGIPSGTIAIYMEASDCPMPYFGRGGQSSGLYGNDGLVLIEYYA